MSQFIDAIKKIASGSVSQKRTWWNHTNAWWATPSQGRVCPSIEFEFISTKMGQDFSFPIKSITRLVLRKLKLVNSSFEFAD